MSSDTYDGDRKPRLLDARRAVVDAARRDGTTCERGAYRARRTIIEHPHNAGTASVVRLERLRDSEWVWVAYIGVVPIRDLRDDWERPSPIGPADVALPEDEFDARELFVDGCSALALPGLGYDSSGGGEA